MKALNGREHGFLLLTSNLGDPNRKPLTVAQFRELAHRSAKMKSQELSRDVAVCDLVSVGYRPKAAEHIIELLNDEALLTWYLHQARKQDIVPITRATQGYPVTVRKRLGMDAPGCLWAKGDLSLLETPMISLVGSRELRDENRAFAKAVGRQAAKQGITLISGNARGADKTAQNACLAAGGRVVSVVADSLRSHSLKENVLYLSESGYDEEFSSQRALSRNRVIHALGIKTFVAQCTYQKGGTWDGTVKNLRFGWSPVFCFDDGSPAMALLRDMGAELVGMDELADIPALQGYDRSFLED